MDRTSRFSQGRRVVVAGGSFAGLAAVFALRKRLPRSDRVILVDPAGIFFFKPSLVSAALGRPAFRASFEIGPVLSSKGVDFIRSAVRRVDIGDRRIETDNGQMEYDVLLIATGGRPNTQSVMGAAGEFRENHFIVGQESSEDVRNRVLQLIREPGRSSSGRSKAGAISARCMSWRWELTRF